MLSTHPWDKEKRRHHFSRIRCLGSGVRWRVRKSMLAQTHLPFCNLRCFRGVSTTKFKQAGGTHRAQRACVLCRGTRWGGRFPLLCLQNRCHEKAALLFRLDARVRNSGIKNCIRGLKSVDSGESIVVSRVVFFLNDQNFAAAASRKMTESKQTFSVQACWTAKHNL